MSEKNELACQPLANQIFSKIAQYQKEQCNVLLPVTTMEELPSGTALSVRVVHVNPDPSGGDVYKSKSGKLALHGHTLDQLAAAAGMSWTEISRTDDRRHPHYCEFRAVGEVRDFDGLVRRYTGTKTLDYRDDAGGGISGKDYAATESNPKELAQARHYITELCAAKAKNRAIRQLLQVRQGYTREELAKPFVVPKLVPDTRNPAVRQMVLAQMTGIAGALYGGMPIEQNVQDAQFEAPATDQVSASSSDQGAGGVGASSPVASTPPAEHGRSSPHDRMVMLWRRFRAENTDEPRDITERKFRAIVEAETDGKDARDLTHSQVDAVELAIAPDGGFPWRGAE